MKVKTGEIIGIYLGICKNTCFDSVYVSKYAVNIDPFLSIIFDHTQVQLKEKNGGGGGLQRCTTMMYLSKIKYHLFSNYTKFV